MRSFDQIIKFTGIAGVVGVLVVTAGCGGGGGGGATGSHSLLPPGLGTLAPGVTSAIATNLIPWKSGDEWFYVVTGSKRDSGNNIVKLNSGSYLARTVGIPSSGDEPGSLTLTDLTYLYSADNKVSSSSLKTYLTQDGTGTLTEVADTAEADGNIEYGGNNPCQLFTMTIVPGLWTSTTGISGSSPFWVPTGVNNTGTNPVCVEGSNLTNQEQTSLTVLDQETVTVPAGTFQTWKVRSSRVYIHQGSTDVQTAWWAPQIGSFVQMQSETQFADGSHNSFTYQLLGFKADPVPIILPLNK